MSGQALLTVSGLTAGYGPVEVLHGLDFTVGEGEIVVILGANGAGKTTTMRAVSGMIPRRGGIEFAGTEISGSKPDAIVRAGVSQVPQGRGTFTDLTVEDNLLAGGYTVKGSVDEDLDRWFDVFPRLGERRDQKAGSLSGGEQQMLAVARAMMSRPKLLLCDEPSLGLAPLITKELFRVLGTLRDEHGMSLLVVEQNAGHVAGARRPRVRARDRHDRRHRNRRRAARRRHDQRGLPGSGELMSLFLERFVNGLADGSIYALLALALVVVFRSTGQLNFAQGEIGTMGAFFVSTLTLSGLPVWLSIGCAMVLGFVVSAGVERIVVRPIEHRNPGAVIVALIGVFLAVNQLVAMIWGVDARSLPSVFPDDADDFVTILGAPIRIARLGVIGVLIVLLFLLWLMFNKTKIGLGMRAVANNQESSNLVGIRVGSILVIGWGLAGAIGVLAAAMLAPSAGLTGTLMLGPFLLASVAAVLGGLDSPVGAVVGGLIIGLTEAFIVGYVDFLGADMLFPVMLLILLVVLLLRPAGLFGSERVERV